MNYVIIGNSAAAVGCVEGIRQQDKKGQITLVSSERYHTYSRPLISYLLYGNTDEQRMKYRPDDFYEKNHVKAILGKTVTSMNPAAKTVTLEDGTEIPYDKLLVATGSKPFVPPMEGLGQVKNKFSFMSLDDAYALEKALGPVSRVLIIGAGLIGLKCAEGIYKRCKSITVVDLADRILPSILDADGAALMQAHLEQAGLQFILSDSVKECKGGTAVLNSGKAVDFDALVLAVGVRPNTELVAAAGGEVNRGIVTDLRCATTLPDVYAAGDCTESYDSSTDTQKIMALLPNAYMQGEHAGINMAGGEVLYKGIPMNAIGFFGIHILSAGSYDGAAYVVKGEKTYKKLVTKDGFLKGFILIGDIARAGIYTKLVREQVPLDAIDFELIREKPQLMAFSRQHRNEKLGGIRS